MQPKINPGELLKMIGKLKELDVQTPHSQYCYQPWGRKAGLGRPEIEKLPTPATVTNDHGPTEQFPAEKSIQVIRKNKRFPSTENRQEVCPLGTRLRM